MSRPTTLIFQTLAAAFTTLVESVAATITAATCSLADVTSAYNAAFNGDTVSPSFTT